MELGLPAPTSRRSSDRLPMGHLTPSPSLGGTTAIRAGKTRFVDKGWAKGLIFYTKTSPVGLTKSRASPSRPFESRKAALEAETKAILTEKPLHNVREREKRVGSKRWRRRPFIVTVMMSDQERQEVRKAGGYARIGKQRSAWLRPMSDMRSHPVRSHAVVRWT